VYAMPSVQKAAGADGRVPILVEGLLSPELLELALQVDDLSTLLVLAPGLAAVLNVKCLDRSTVAYLMTLPTKAEAKCLQKDPCAPKNQQVIC